MYTTYVVHVKTAFHVRGVTRRFSDFVTLDRQLRAKFPAAPELKRTSRIIGTLSPGFVQERRQQLQEYLDLLLSDHQLAASQTTRAFLALHGCTDIGIVDDGSEPRPEDGAEGEGAEGGGAGQVLEERAKGHLWDAASADLGELQATLSRCRSAKDAPIEAMCLNKIGLAYCERGEHQLGIKHLSQAVASARLCPNRRALLACLWSLGCAHCQAGGRKAATEVLMEGVSVAQRIGDASAEAGSLRMVGLAQAADGDIASGLITCQEVRGLYVSAGDLYGEAATLFTMGVMRYEAGMTVEGVADMESSLRLRRVLKDKVGIAEVLNRLGLALVDIGYHLQALDYLERALALCQEVGDLIGQAHSLRLLAYLHFAQVDGDRKLSLELFKKSLSLSKRNRDVLGQAMCHEGVADVLADIEDFKLSAHHYAEAMSLREKGLLPNGVSLAGQDPQGHVRHISLIRSKTQRVQQKVRFHKKTMDTQDLNPKP
jgi:tetratricopeptide (TPR) repeat protein